MGERRVYKPEVKAAVMAALLSGQSVNSVAREYNLPLGTVKSWKNREVSRVAPPKNNETIGDLLGKYLEANLRTLIIQVEVFADPEWLKKQDAADVAVLHGVMTDKAIRLLDAMGANEDDS